LIQISGLGLIESAVVAKDVPAAGTAFFIELKSKMGSWQLCVSGLYWAVVIVVL